jgi:hypothetical protein
MPKQLVKTNHSISMLSYLALFILADQLFLPVPRLFGISLFKPSYWILLAWPLIVVTYKRGYVAIGEARRFFKMTGPVMGILVCGLLGQLYLSTLGNIYNANEAFRATAFYLMMVFAFGFGQLVPNFRCRWLLWLFYATAALVLFLVFTIDRFPVFAQLYYHTPENVEKLLAMSQIRHRGLGNPNSTMLLVNIVFLFLVVSVRLGYLSRLQKHHIILTSTLNMVVCFILASRNQMIASIILVTFFAATSVKHWTTKIFATIALFFVIIAFFVFFGNTLRNNFTFIDDAYSRFATTAVFDITEERQAETIMRPLIHWRNFSDRFLESPFIGSGYSTLYSYPFDRLPNFHNDWFRVWATSGAIGGLLFFLWMFRIYKNFGLLVLLPFFLPGLTNTFLRNTPAVIVYCLMLGILIEKKFRTEAKMTISGSSSSFSANPHTRGG